jgi:hypothetical protein
MGMFDYIECQAELPMPEDLSSLELNAINRFLNVDDFQTKDLDCSMTRYVIDQDGLFREKIFSTGRNYFYEVSDPVYIHQHLRCYGIVEISDEEKFWLEYDLKFTNGIMVNTKVLDWHRIQGNE